MNTFIKKSNSWALLVLLFGVIVSSCRKDNDDDLGKNNLVKNTTNTELISSWNREIGKIDYAYGEYRPCPIATVLAYSNFAAYETAVPGMPDYRSLKDVYSGLNLPKYDASKEVNWPLAINAAYGYMYKLYFPKEPALIANQEELMKSKYSTGVSTTVVNNSIEWGQSVAKAVYAYSQSDLVTFDGYLNTTPAYSVKTDPGTWVPTPPDFSPGKFPQWGKGRTLAINEADKQIPAPLPYSTDKNSQYYNQALECYSTVVNGTAEDKWIAEFWSDDLAQLTFSPPVRWLEIANQVYQVSTCNLQKALVTNTKICFGLNDAAIACWDQKFKWQVERPITFIHKYIDPNFKTILTTDGLTPNFPTYPSGHGTFGSAAAEVLTYEFGTDFGMTDRCHQGRTEFNGTPRSFENFYAMSEENADSRIPLGVHFRMDAKEALKLGYRIGRKVNQLPWGQ